MQIRLNGDPTTVPDGLNVASLLAHLSLRPERVAVERNRQVARRADWETTLLQPGDELEILTFVGGG